MKWIIWKLYIWNTWCYFEVQVCIKDSIVCLLSPFLSFLFFSFSFSGGLFDHSSCGRCGEVVDPTNEEPPKADAGMTETGKETM